MFMDNKLEVVEVVEVLYHKEVTQEEQVILVLLQHHFFLQMVVLEVRMAAEIQDMEIQELHQQEL